MFFIGTSWKMNKTLAEARAYVAALEAADLPRSPEWETVIIPPFTALATVREALGDLPVRLGAQNLMWLDAGAFTGEISAPMLKDVGCVLVEIGHSERRRLFAETDERINAKVRAALRCGLDALICVGDTLDERAAGAAADAVLRQARMALADVPRNDHHRCRIAYEPVWAIGEGGTAASPEEAAAVHAMLKDAFPDIPVIYGGSIDQANAAALAARPEIDGLFIGRAALDPANFIAIHASARATRRARA